MRGKQDRPKQLPGHLRNIPAYAGKTRLVRLWSAVRTEHPRVCGENVGVDLVDHGNSGTSPRMRGKPPRVVGGLLCERNIPAYAGKTGLVVCDDFKL